MLKCSHLQKIFVGTAYPVEDHFEVLIPTVAQLDKMLSLAGGVEGIISGSGNETVTKCGASCLETGKSD